MYAISRTRPRTYGIIPDIRGLDMIIILVILTLSASLASGGETAGEDTWKVTLEPYVWALGNKVRIATDQFDRSDFTGYIDALVNQYQYGFLGVAKLYRQRWGFYTDFHFVRLKDEARELGLPYASDIRQILVESSLMYRVGDDINFTELFTGIRYFRMKSRVDVAVAGKFRDLFEWVDPMVGVRVSRGIGKRQRWRWQISGDASGFNLGSDFTWQANASLVYRLNERRSLSVGYRHLDIKYSDSSRRYESRMSGPYLGFAYHFRLPKAHGT